MKNFLRNALGIIYATETSTHITLGGVRTASLLQDIYKAWETSKISLNMFSKLSNSEISFPKFFAPDVHYMLQQLSLKRRTRFGAGALETALKVLEEETWLKRLSEPVTSRLDKSKVNLFHLSPLPHQSEFFELYDDRVQRYGMTGYLLSAAAGSGKAQPLDAMIRIPGGWKTMGDMKPGDTVTAWDGREATVTGVYPQGVKDVYKFTFKDGRTARACGDHLWRVYNNREVQTKPGYCKVIDTKEIIQRLATGKRVHIDLCQPEQGQDVKFDIDPYLLGVLLGDGSLSQKSIAITKNDEELFDHVKAVLPDDVELIKRDNDSRSLSYGITRKDKAQRNSVVDALTKLGLMGTYSDTKFIPPEYLEGSLEQRLALLQGLLDTDGTVDKENTTVSFCTTSALLAHGIQKLIWSVGGIAKISPKQTFYTYNDIRLPGKPSYNVNIRIKKLSSLFRLSRKRDLTNDNNQYSSKLKLELIRVEKVESVPCRCISIDHPDHLYITNNYVVTHNTLTGLMLAEMLHADQVIMIVPKNAVWKVWSRHLSEEYKQPQAHWIAADDKPYNGEKFLIGHYESLDKVIAAVRTNHKSNAFVILDESHNMNEAGSLRTQKFIELCKTVGAKNVLWSSGTPLKALGYEAIPLLTTIDPLFTPEVQERFKKIYGREAKRALDILRNRMGIISYRVEKTSVVDNKPTTHEISVEIPNAKKYELETIGNEMRSFIKKRLEHYEDRKKYYEKVYDDALRIHEKTLDTREQKAAFATYKTYIATIRKGYDSYTMGPLSQYCNRYELTVIMPTLSRELRAEFKNARSVVKYVELKVLGEALGGVLGKARVNCHLDMLPGIPFADVINGAQKKTVIFTSYVEVADAIDKRLRAEGFSPLVVHGGTNKNLSSIVTEFEKNAKANPLIATYQSLSTAVPLIVANTTIFINQPFRDGDLTQARARTDRLGQDAPVHFWNCLLNTGDKPNISTRSRDIMQWSRDQIAAIMGDSYSHDVAQVLTSAGGAYAEEAITEQDVMALEYYHETI